MKTTFLFIITLLASQSFLFANGIMSSLKIINPQNEPIAVQLDAYAFSSAATEHYFENLRPGVHQVKLAKVHFDRFGRKHLDIIGVQQIQIQARTNSLAVLNAFNTLQIVSVETIHSHRPVMCTPAVVMPHPVHPIHPIQPIGVSAPDFHQFLAVVNKQSFESSKLDLMRGFIRQNQLNSLQVKVLMDALTFESSKLEIAKTAFDYVLDPNNFYVVNDAFTFESSIRRLSKAIYG